MKTLLAIGMSAWAGLFGLTCTSNAVVFNGSFESWNLIGWTVDMPHGISANAPFDRTAGGARTVTSWGEDHGLATPRMPQDGNRFAQLRTRANADFVGDDTYNLSLTQTVHMNQGDTLSGWSFFYNGDLQPQDSAWVRIADELGNDIATPWLEGSGSLTLSSVAPLSATDWTRWEWTSPGSAVYTIRLGMTTRGNNNGGSYAFFDGMNLEAANSVPEPSAAVLGLLGAFCLTYLRRPRAC